MFAVSLDITNLDKARVGIIEIHLEFIPASFGTAAWLVPICRSSEHPTKFWRRCCSCSYNFTDNSYTVSWLTVCKLLSIFFGINNSCRSSVFPWNRCWEVLGFICCMNESDKVDINCRAVGHTVIGVNSESVNIVWINFKFGSRNKYSKPVFSVCTAFGNRNCFTYIYIRTTEACTFCCCVIVERCINTCRFQCICFCSISSPISLIGSRHTSVSHSDNNIVCVACRKICCITCSIIESIDFNIGVPNKCCVSVFSSLSLCITGCIILHCEISLFFVPNERINCLTCSRITACILGIVAVCRVLTRIEVSFACNVYNAFALVVKLNAVEVVCIVVVPECVDCNFTTVGSCNYIGRIKLCTTCCIWKTCKDLIAVVNKLCFNIRNLYRRTCRNLNCHIAELLIIAHINSKNSIYRPVGVKNLRNCTSVFVEKSTAFGCRKTYKLTVINCRKKSSKFFACHTACGIFFDDCVFFADSTVIDNHGHRLGNIPEGNVIHADCVACLCTACVVPLYDCNIGCWVNTTVYIVILRADFLIVIKNSLFPIAVINKHEVICRVFNQILHVNSEGMRNSSTCAVNQIISNNEVTVFLNERHLTIIDNIHIRTCSVGSRGILNVITCTVCLCNKFSCSITES